MLPTASRRPPHGFSMIEVVVVLAVIGVLLVVAVPSLSGSDATATDRDAQASLSAALDAQQFVHEAIGTFSEDPDTLAAANPEIDFVGPATPAASSSQVSVAVTGSVVSLASAGGDGTCWMLRRDYLPPAGERSELYAWSPTQGACTGAWAAAAPEPADPDVGRAWSDPHQAP